LQSGVSMTLEQAIRQAAVAFEEHELVYGHGTEDAVSEASWLILHALSLSPVEAPNYQRILSPDDVLNCDTLLTQRIEQRIPAAYITGTAWFAGIPLRCDQRALVPRSPLAEFILSDFYDLVDSGQVQKVLDLCTGGGCIAIATAMQLPHAKVDASDLSSDALALAALNVADHQLQDRITLIEGSLFENVHGPYDLILSNPPYVDAGDIDSMGAEFQHEPMMGLAAGNDGLDLVKTMLNEAAEMLSESGVMVVEVGNSAPAVEALYPDVPLQWLEFERGGQGVFAVERTVLLEHADALAQACKRS